MTAISLHALPSPRRVAEEQIAAVGLSLRKEGIGLLVVFLVASLLILLQAWRTAHTPVPIPMGGGAVGYPMGGRGMSFGPLAAIPVAMLAFLMPYGAWGSGNPGSRRYMYALPVDARDHAIIRVMAGWLWMMAAVAAYMIWILLLIAVSNQITGRHSESTAPWTLLVPFTSATVAYLLGSIAMVGSRHPLRWMAGIALTWFLVAAIVDVNMKGMGMNPALQLFQGELGLGAAMFGDISHLTSTTTRYANHTTMLAYSEPVLRRWLWSTLIWGVPALGAVLFMASRRRDE